MNVELFQDFGDFSVVSVPRCRTLDIFFYVVLFGQLYHAYLTVVVTHLFVKKYQLQKID